MRHFDFSSIFFPALLGAKIKKEKECGRKNGRVNE
jgi:hypothetical protein